jgi:glucosamine--fructose-6-phosphate aminotransferase (isomerizing)
VKRARGKGAFTVAITNGTESSLADAADATLGLVAGPERAVAASKTFLNTLAAMAWVAGGAAERGREIAEGLRRVAEQLAGSLGPLEQAVSNVAMAFAYVGRMYVIGRGIEFGTAREVALKLTETCRVAAEPLTATDLAHGPIAALDSMFPVWTIASRDESLPAVLEAAARVIEAGATVVASGNAATEIEGAAHVLPVPEAPLPILSPLLSVVPGQLFAGALARAKGLDADYPVGLSKVTRAR